MKGFHQDAMALATRLLIDRGALKDHAVLQAGALIEAELKGHPSHGLQRLPRLLSRIERGLANPHTAGLSEWRADSAIAQSALAPDIRGTLDAEAVCNKGDVPIVIQPPSAPGLGHRLEAFLQAIRASTAAEPGYTVRVPGDGTAQRHSQLLREGFDVRPELWDELQALASSSSISFTPPALH